MSTLSLRISNPYGEGQRAVRGQGVVAAAMQHAMTGDVMPIWGDGTIERDFIHVVDVASAFAVAASHRTSLSALNIGSGKGTSIKALLAMVEAAVGRPVRADYRHGRVVDVHRNVLDVEQAFAQLGWRPQIQLQAGLDRTADWWRRQHSVSAPL
jgi:UDP-glucose 4-epimerase